MQNYPENSNFLSSLKSDLQGRRYSQNKAKKHPLLRFFAHFPRFLLADLDEFFLVIYLANIYLLSKFHVSSSVSSGVVIFSVPVHPTSRHCSKKQSSQKFGLGTQKLMVFNVFDRQMVIWCFWEGQNSPMSP